MKVNTQTHTDKILRIPSLEGQKIDFFLMLQRLEKETLDNRRSFSFC